MESSLATGTCSSPSTAGQPKGCPYRTLFLVFNHRKAFANLQTSSSIADSAYQFENAAHWQELTVPPQCIPGPVLPRFDLQVTHSS